MNRDNDPAASCNTTDRGVNVHSESFETEHKDKNNVKEYIKNAIDSMGPNTPHYSGAIIETDVENDESVYTTTSVLTTYTKVKQNPNFPVASPKDFTDISIQESDISPQDWSHYNNPYSQHICSCEHRHHIDHPDYNETDGKILYTSNRRKDLLNKKGQSRFKSKFKWFCSNTHKNREPLDLYKINIIQPRNDHSPPRRFVFDLIDDVPKPETQTIATNTRVCNNQCSKTTNCNFTNGIHKHKINQANMHYVKNIPESYLPNQKNYGIDAPQSRVDVYYFDHGNAAYYRTTDTSPLLMTELLAEKTEIYTTKFWAQLFGTIHIAFAFVTSFILQLLRFILQSLIRPLTVGLTQMLSDYFCKPCLAILFNGVIQPPLIFLYNIAASLRDICEPIAESIGCYVRELSGFCQALRLVDINKISKCDNCQTSSKNDCKDAENSKNDCDEKECEKKNKEII